MDKSYFNSNDENLKWHENSRKIILSTRVFDVTERVSTASDGTSGTYIVNEASDWVIIIPVHGENFLMVKQWRHGEKALSVEFPGGVIEKGEDVEAAAKRELLEETGSVPGKMTCLGKFNPNPALFSNHVYVYLAQELVFTDRQNLDKDEFLNYVELSQKEVLEQMGTSEFHHALMASALCLYLKYTGSK